VLNNKIDIMRKFMFFFTLIFLTSFSLKLFASNNFNVRINSFAIASMKLNSNVNGINLNFSSQRNFQLRSDFIMNESFKSTFDDPFMNPTMKPFDYNYSAYAIPPSTTRADPFTRTFIGGIAGLLAAAVIGGENVSGGALIAGTVIGGVLGFVVWQVTIDDLLNR
jgi:hypothetical protein